MLIIFHLNRKRVFRKGKLKKNIFILLIIVERSKKNSPLQKGQILLIFYGNLNFNKGLDFEKKMFEFQILDDWNQKIQKLNARANNL